MEKTLILKIKDFKKNKYDEKNKMLIYKFDVNEDTKTEKLNHFTSVILSGNGQVFLGKYSKFENNKIYITNVDKFDCDVNTLSSLKSTSRNEFINITRNQAKGLYDVDNLDIEQIKKDIEENNLCHFFIIKESKFENLKSKFEEKDRIAFIDDNLNITKLKIYNSKKTINDMEDHLEFKEINLNELLEKHEKAEKKRDYENKKKGIKTRPGTNITELNNMINGINKDDYYEFKDFTKLYNILINKSKLQNNKDEKKVIKKENSENNNTANNKTKETKQPLNQILYGPPGTGKTYNTVIKAMEIIDPNKYKDYKDKKIGYNKLKEEFDKLKQARQIEFITFHQSYSYEEFIEGIKPNLKDNGLKYILKDGILKKIYNRSFKDLYEKKGNISFEYILNECKERYPEGTDLETLKNISYDKKNLKFNFGIQTKPIPINLNKIKKIFENNKEYKNAKEFNDDYKENPAYDCYYYKFYKKLTTIKNELEKQNLNENTKEYKIKENPNKYVLIIDEINRGNISKIFGEMITLIEEDKRIGNEHELRLTLPYSGEKFGIPNNLYIIGTMNTSDRSIASVDIALRRRFKFIEMMPKSELVTNISIGKTTFQEIFKALNEKITILLDRDHQIGHSYFLEEKINSNEENLKNIWFSEILPLLNEYFYNDWDKLQALLGEAELKKDKEGQEKNSSFIVKRDLSKYNMKDIDDEDKYIYDFVDKDKVDFKKALLKIVDIKQESK